MTIPAGPYITHVFGDTLREIYRNHRGWVTVAIHNSIPWPESDVLVKYDGDSYFLRGMKGNDDQLREPCISFKLNRWNDEPEVMLALNKIYKFSSILGWFLRGYVDPVGHITGTTPLLYSSGRQPFAPVLAAGPHGFNCNFMPVIRSEEVRIALAFWREGLRLKNFHGSYSFLSFYKVIESQFDDGRARGRWINNAIPNLDGDAARRVAELQGLGLDVGDQIFLSGRCAVAHASLGAVVVDPDIPADRMRIAKDLVVVRALAERYIRDELGVPTIYDVFETRDALTQIHEYLDPAHIQMLQNGGSVPYRNIGLNGVNVSVSLWPHAALDLMKNLVISAVSAQDGEVKLLATNAIGTASLGFSLNFHQRKAFPIVEMSTYFPVERGGRPDDEIAVLEFRRFVLGNGIIEIEFPNSEKVVCEVVLPVNIDLGRSLGAIAQRIAQLQAM